MTDEEFDKIWQEEHSDYVLVDKSDWAGVCTAKIFRKENQYFKLKRIIDEYGQIRNKKVVEVIPEQKTVTVWKEKT